MDKAAPHGKKASVFLCPCNISVGLIELGSLLISECGTWPLLFRSPLSVSLVKEDKHLLLYCCYVNWHFSTCLVDRLVGQVVKASTWGAEDPWFESRLQPNFFGVKSYQ